MTNRVRAGRDEQALRTLDTLAPVTLTVDSSYLADDEDDHVLAVTLASNSGVPALNARLSLVDALGARILPAYWSDNYVALLPGEQRTLIVHFPAIRSAAKISLDGWNVLASSFTIGARHSR